ncbi:MAG: helix-turn-helix transcriptional regulator [Actinoplanes sp.]
MRTQSDGETIRRLREERGLTLKELAGLAQISEAHMCRLENEERHGTRDVRLKVATALGTDLATISKPVPRIPRQRAEAA